MWTRVISDLTIQTPYSRRYNDVLDIGIRRPISSVSLHVCIGSDVSRRRKTDVGNGGNSDGTRYQLRRGFYGRDTPGRRTTDVLSGGNSDGKTPRRRKTDVLEVARETSWRWKERRLGGGKRDVLEVARETSWRWKERR
jgi:hypothetical protein